MNPEDSGVMADLKLTPTSDVTADAGDFVLRQTSTTRLIFRSLIVANPNDPEATVKGELVHQRKSPNDNWEDHNTLTLSELKADEWVKLRLKSGEVLRLFTHLNQLYELYSEEGIPRRTTRYVQVESHVAALLEASDEEFERFFRTHARDGIRVLHRLLSWLSKFGQPQHVIEKLETLDPATLEQFNAAVGVGALKQALDLWEEERRNGAEDFWQRTFLDNWFILSQTFTFPVVLVRDGAYVGGKKIDNRGGKLVDYLVANEMTQNASLIEIKTPQTSLLGGEYRPGVFAPSSNLSGAVAQAEDYRLTFLSNYSRHTDGPEAQFGAFAPRAVVIAGDAQSELQTREKARSFEIYRNGLRAVEVITFDELFGKVRGVVDVLEEGLQVRRNR